jgi:hypothetical protein
MTTENADDERSIDTEQYDTDEAARIARDRLADELDPAAFGQADDLSRALAELVADLRGGELTVQRVGAVCTEIELLYDALEDLSRLHGWGWEESTDAHVERQPAPDREHVVDVPDGLGEPTPPQSPPVDEYPAEQPSILLHVQKTLPLELGDRRFSG